MVYFEMLLTDNDLEKCSLQIISSQGIAFLKAIQEMNIQDEI